jgi:cyclase
MSIKRIIPCLDIRDGRVVKGVKFEGARDVDDPAALARRYCEEGADELVFYDITASIEGRMLFDDVLKRTAREVSIPLTVGGGIASVGDFEHALALGADKVSVNTGAINDPGLIGAASAKFGKGRVVFAMDVKREGGKFAVMTKGGRVKTELDAIEWAAFGEGNGAGELVVNSVDTDGVKEGFDLELLEAICGRVRIPVVASGGAGGVGHFVELFKRVPSVDAGLAASIFHFGEVGIQELKMALRGAGIEARI